MNIFDEYELALRISPVPMLLVSQAGEIILSNDLLNQLFGYAPDELAGNNVEILVPEGIRQRHPDLRKAYFRVPAKRNMGRGRELNGITRSGQVIPLELGLDTVSIDGQLYALVMALDIRQRKQQEWRMSMAMDAAANAMIMINAAGVIKFVNKAALKLFGYQEETLLESPIERLVPREVRHVHPVYRESFTSAGKARAMAEELDLYALHRDGHQIPVEIALIPVDTPDGKMIVSTITDLSERVAAKNAMSRKSEELTLLNNELMQFAYSASHDLKAPLSTMNGLLDMCLEDLKEGNLQEVQVNIEKTLKIGRRSADKVENVLEIARAGRDSIPPGEAFELAVILEEVWQDLSASRYEHVQLILSLGHHEPVDLERKTLKVILENLVSNALRYSDESKERQTIEITTRQEGDILTFTLGDNGIGIPAERQSAVFEMFKRVDDRSESGLGLALVRKHIDRLGGSISFTSTEGLGTEFVFSLPLLQGDNA